MMQHLMPISRYLAFTSRLLIILAISVSIFEPTSKAAIIRVEPDIEQHPKGNILDPIEDSLVPAERSNSDGKIHKLLASRFIVLSTGSDIKLYPIQLNERQSNAFETIGHYTIKSREFNISDEETVDRLGANSSFTRWLQRKATIEAARLNGSKRLSILPSSNSGKEFHGSNQDDDELYGLEWKKPLISDVDYFFDATFCSNNTNEGAFIKQESCLVLVWLDKRNKFVRFGSINLITSPIEMLDSTSNDPTTQTNISPNKLFYLDEFPPLDICKLASRSGFQSKDCDVFKMVVDRQRGELHCLLNVLGSPSKLRVFSGQLKPRIRQGDQIVDTTIITINTCPRDTDQQPVNVKSAHFDEAGGSWMFYLNGANRIMAFDIKLARFYNLGHASRFNRITNVTPVLVDVDHYDYNEHASTAAMTLAVNSIDRKIYRLTDTSELFSSNLAGSDLRLIGKLSAKPVIRMPGTMQVFHDTVFFSDLARHSIMMYKLNHGNLDHRHQSADMKSTHKVLIVEMSRIQSFCLIDLNDSVEDYNESEPDAINTTFKSKIFSDEITSWFGRSTTRNESADVYEQLQSRAIDPCIDLPRDIHEKTGSFSPGDMFCLAFIILGFSFFMIALVRCRKSGAKKDGQVKYPV